MAIVIGWDIGGAHLKAARVEAGRVTAVRQIATPLWLGTDSLERAFTFSKDELGKADRHAITMTGELCDAYATRREGVAELSKLAARRLAPDVVSIYAGAAGFVDLAAVPKHVAGIASANWHATAALVGRKLDGAILVDIGSTTTDVIPIVAGRVAACADTELRAAGGRRTRLYRYEQELCHGHGAPRPFCRGVDAADE